MQSAPGSEAFRYGNAVDKRAGRFPYLIVETCGKEALSAAGVAPSDQVGVVGRTGVGKALAEERRQILRAKLREILEIRVDALKQLWSAR
jgi:hypothetical protein